MLWKLGLGLGESSVEVHVHCSITGLQCRSGFCLKPGLAWPRKTRPPQPNYRPGPDAAICKGPAASNTARPGVTKLRRASELSL